MGDFKDLPRGTASGKVLHDKAFNIAKNPKYDGYQRGIHTVFYKFFEKTNLGSAIEKLCHQQLPEELDKPVIRKFEKRNV